jgi:hypothetical protein
MSEPAAEANGADVQEQQQTPDGQVPDGTEPDLDRLERDLGTDGPEGDVAEQSQD